MNKKIRLIVVLLIYILVSLFSVSSYRSIVAESDTIAVDFNISPIDAQGKLEYLTGEKIGSNLTFGLSGNSTSGVLRLKIKAENLAVKSVDELFKRNVLATSWEKGLENGYYYANYYFDKIDGGTNFRVPIQFSWNQETTPMNATTQIIAEFEREGGIKYNRELVYTAKTQPAKFIHYVENMSGESRSRTMIDGKSTMASGVGYPNGDALPTTTPDDDSTWSRYVIGLDSSKNIYGNYTPIETKITYKLPEGAVMRGNSTYVGGGLSFNWIYDAQTHIATYTGPLTSDKKAYIELDFPNQLYTTVHTSQASMISDEGTVNQFNYDLIDEHVKWNPYNRPIIPPPPGGINGLIATKSIRRPIRQFFDDDGFFWNPDRSSIDIAEANWNVVGGQFHMTRVNFQAGIDATSPRYAYVTEITEEEIDSRLYFYRYDFADVPNDVLTSLQKGWRLYGTRANGEEVLIHEIRSGTINGAMINDTQGQYVKLRIVFNEPIKLGSNTDPNHGFRFNVFTPVKSEIWNSWTVEDLGYETLDRAHPNRMYASSKYSYYYANSDGSNADPIQTRTANEHDSRLPLRVSTFYRAERTRIASWNGDDQIVTATGTEDDEFLIKGDLDVIVPNNSSRIPVENVKLITLLPEGLDFIEGSESNGYAGNAKVVENYKNTGRNAVIISFDDVTWNQNNAHNSDILAGGRKVERYVSFRVRPTEYLEYGENIVEQFITWDNNEDVQLQNGTGYKTAYIDTLDLDNDGNTTETFIRGTNRVVYEPTNIVELRKYISLDKQNWNTRISSLLDADSEFYYKVLVVNHTTSPISSANVLDVLPYSKDKRIVANDMGIYGERQSILQVQLSRSIESLTENTDFLNKWKILYSLDNQGSTTHETDNAKFVEESEINDFNKVKLVKLVLKEGQIIDIKERVEVVIPAKVPYSTDFSLFDKANNTVALQIPNESSQYREGSVVTAQVSRYAVTGTAFSDINKNGYKERSEPVLEGYVVQLMNGDGTVAINPLTGEEIKTTTNSNGEYRFEIFKRGSYYVKVFKKDQSEIFTKLYTENGIVKSGTSSVKEGVIGNDTSEDDLSTGRTAIFDLNPNQIPEGLDKLTDNQVERTLMIEDNTLRAVRNIGFENIVSTTEVSVKKVWNDANNQDGKRPESIQFLLTKTIEGVVSDTNYSVTLDSSDTDGYIFKDLLTVENGKPIIYGIKEINVPKGYTSEVSEDKTQEFIVTNHYTPETITVSGMKEWNDANNQDGKRPESITVRLYADGEEVANQEVTSEKNWQYEFNNLSRFKNGKEIVYTIGEDEVAEYTSSVVKQENNLFTITNTYQSKLVDIKEVEKIEKQENSTVKNTVDTSDNTQKYIILAIFMGLFMVLLKRLDNR